MMNGVIENDHAFSIEADIVKLNDVGDRLLVEGYLGEIIEIGFSKDSLEIRGIEGNLIINVNKEELGNLLHVKVANKRL